MDTWLDHLKYNPIPALLSPEKVQVVYFTNRDLLNQPVESIETLWILNIPSQILHKEQANG